MKIGRISLLVLILSIGFNLNAQKDRKETSKLSNQSKIKIGLFYSLDKNLSDKNQLVSKYERYSADYNKQNYSLSTEIEYSLNRNLFFLSGITYTNRDFTGTYYCAVCDFIGNIEPGIIKQRFLEVPVIIRYYFLPNKVLIYSEAGIVNQFAVNSDLDENSYSIGGKLAVGIGYQLSKSYSIEISTNFQNGISNLYKDSNFKQQILGFKMGIKKNL